VYLLTTLKHPLGLWMKWMRHNATALISQSKKTILQPGIKCSFDVRYI
jgi:hypothetical protein